MKQGVLVYDQKTDRMEVRFNLEEYYGGLHCGPCMEGLGNNRGNLTRVEYACGDTGWYLVGIPTSSLTGLRVRMS